MSIWLREVAGWLLLGIGLGVFALSGFSVLVQRWLLTSLVLAGLGFFVFRGGLHLLKVAMAARAATEVNRTVTAKAKAKAPKPIQTISMGGPAKLPGRPQATVIPGRTADRP